MQSAEEAGSLVERSSTYEGVNSGLLVTLAIVVALLLALCPYYVRGGFFFLFFFKIIFPEGQDWTGSTMWLILSPLLSGGKIPEENPGEKPSLRSSRWDSNLWPLTPQSSALTTRPPTTMKTVQVMKTLVKRVGQAT